MANLGHWATIESFIRAELIPSYVDGEDKSRIFAYDLYESIYWTAPESFKLTMRGQEGQPLYIPSGRKIVDTVHRYMAPKMTVKTDPTFGTPAQQEEATLFFNDFAAREKFYSKFSSAKLYGIMRGDWLFHIMADPERVEGARVSIFAQHPGTYFPVFAEDDPTERIGVKLVEPGLKPDGKPAVNVLEYTKLTGTGGPSPIEVSNIQYEVDGWGQPETDMGTKVVATIAPTFTLPPPIDAIPVYHLPNMYETDFTWGSSEMRGVELMMRGINQAITDEELALVLEGLGVYTTDAGAPIDEETEEELPWTVAPGRVIELPAGHTFNRVSGVSSVTPYMEHLNYLHTQLESTTGQNDITNGRAEVAVAESGIALALRMAPILSKMEEKELVVTDILNHLLFDIRRWFDAYEPLSFEEIRWVPQYGDKMPRNKQQEFNDVMAMYSSVPPLISGAEARRMLTSLGFTFTEEGVLTGEIQRDLTTTADAEASRILGGVSGP